MKEPIARRLGRCVPLAGVAFAVLTAAAFLTMGKNPEPDVPISEVTSFYAAHDANFVTGGIMLAYAAILFALFGMGIWARIHRAGLHPVVACAALVGTAVATVAQLAGAMTYYVLGDIGGKHTISAPAIQTLHLVGSELSLPIAGGVEILLLAVAAAGIFAGMFPRWLAWSALVIGVLQLVPSIGFTAFLVFLLWTAIASVAMALRPAVAASGTARDGAPLPA